ncbi:transposase family protein [Telmatocola sphagniphila]|uniref:Transposase family protein n=1 Tax=Telmatocola sphagniphila TaxID=1123043 RepID=A0A8E6B8R0_9BACT|nr:hypothetical protein [Telmatocola sphagniphila]QVL34215.1 transposase family protein [Telmatocola sphagniphila]
MTPENEPIPETPGLPTGDSKAELGGGTPPDSLKESDNVRSSMRHRREIDDLLALKLGTGSTIKAAAEAAGVSEKTVYRRLKRIHFKQQILGVRHRLLSESTGLLAAQLNKAVLKLSDLVDSQTETVALAACRALFDASTKMTEMIDFAIRLEILEFQQKTITKDLADEK